MGRWWLSEPIAPRWLVERGYLADVDDEAERCDWEDHRTRGLAAQRAEAESNRRSLAERIAGIRRTRH